MKEEDDDDDDAEEEYQKKGEKPMRGAKLKPKKCWERAYSATVTFSGAKGLGGATFFLSTLATRIPPLLDSIRTHFYFSLCTRQFEFSHLPLSLKFADIVVSNVVTRIVGSGTSKTLKTSLERPMDLEKKWISSIPNLYNKFFTIPQTYFFFFIFQLFFIFIRKSYYRTGKIRGADNDFL